MKKTSLNQVKRLGSRLKLLTHPVIIKILAHIHDNGPVPVTNIYKKLKLEQSVTSSMLSKLRKARFVNAKKEGRKVFYTINYDEISDVCEGIVDFFKA